jgi:UDP-4-amino-4-deoxy-L-arabinose-oxoglutarate aminotransferase
LTDIQAALGVAQFSRLADFNRRRAELVAIYREGLEGIDGVDLPGDPPYPHDHSNHLFVVKIRAMERDRFMERLSDHNIGYGLHFPACHLLKYVKERFGVAKLPVTERVVQNILSFPLFPDMKDDDVAYVCEAVREILVGAGGGGN